MDAEMIDRCIAEDYRAVTLMHGTIAERDKAPFDDLVGIESEVAEAFQECRCAVIRPRQAAYTAGNSLVYCGPDIVVSDLFAERHLRVATTVVIIYGHADEELHRHTSHVLSCLIEGNGCLYGETWEFEARPGDLVVIPRGVRHVFNCAEGQRMLIFAVEISDGPIDHQKNYYGSAQ
jgi:quercetin dioxygenase-like cupin family protein